MRVKFATTDQCRLDRHLERMAWCRCDTAQKCTLPAELMLMPETWGSFQNHSELLTMAEWLIWDRLLAWGWASVSATVFPQCAKALGSCENTAPKSNCHRAELLTFQKINYGTELETSFWKLHHTYELDTCCSRKTRGNGCWLHCYFPSVWEKVFLLFAK